MSDPYSTLTNELSALYRDAMVELINNIKSNDTIPENANIPHHMDLDRSICDT